MLHSPSRFVVLLFLCALVALPLYSEEPHPGKPTVSTKAGETQKKPLPDADGKKVIERKKADLSALPPDAVIVICEQANEALDLSPKAVILRPEKYRELLDQIDKLKKQIASPKNENATPPTRCALRGKVGAGVVRFEAEFSGSAEHADTLVTLACQQAGVSSAEADGKMAQIRRSNAGGFIVRLEKSGEYHIKLDLVLPLIGREGNSRGFELALPRAVITQLELDLPAECMDVRIGGQLVKDLQLPGLELKNNHLSGSPGVGTVDKLDLSWKESRRFTGDPVRTAEGRIRASLDASGLTTEADLWLTAEGAPAKVWRLLVPRNAEIKVLSSDPDSRIEDRIETDDQKYSVASLRTIQLKEPRSDPLHVRVKIPPMPLRDSALPIGPFFVLDAARQTGTVMVRNQLRNLHLDYRGHGDMQLRRQETEETRGETPAIVATLVYSNIPKVERPESTVGPKSLSWLDLEAVQVPAQARMRVSHTLTLRQADGVKNLAPGLSGDGLPAAASAGLYWQVVTTVTPATKWIDIEQLKILMPQEWEPIDESGSVVPNSNPGSVAIPSSLLRESSTQSQRVEGRYKVRYKSEDRAVLKLPRPQGAIESCDVKLEAPADIELFLNNAEQLNLELSRQPRPNEQIWRSRGTPVAGLDAELSWRPYRPELRVVSGVDLTLNGNRGEVHQVLRLQLPPMSPPFVTLRVPASVGETLRIHDDQGQEIRPLKAEIRKANSDGSSPPSDIGYRIPVLAKESGKEWRLDLRYSTRLGEKDGTPQVAEPFLVPLIGIEQATAGDLKVRIWSSPGSVPRSAGGRWEEQSIEEVNDRALPMLVLRASKLDAPLRLVLTEQAAGVAALVERALMRVQVNGGGAQNWQARFQIRQLAEGNLDILMPAAVMTLNAEFVFNHHLVTPVLVNESGGSGDAGNIARLRLPCQEPTDRAGSVSKSETAVVHESGLLEISFRLPPGRGGAGPLLTTLQPPRLLRAAAVPTYWEVSIPPNRVLLAPESAPEVERIWTRRSWLLEASVVGPPELQSDNELVGLVCWQDQGMPIVLTHVPQLAWWLLCSLGMLILGLRLYWTTNLRRNDGGRLGIWFWPMLAAATLAVAVAALFRPTMLCAIVYGCEPGVVVLLFVVGVQLLMHQRYRRRTVFLPSFSRRRTDSSLIRKSISPPMQRGEPSTVDAPPPGVG